ncbi:glycosyltransferase [Jeotgalibacillus soli]|uniref:Glycosyltransferase 2-like domain-containing protein n=1 Tax=Jeotgalibacillus soli TaxID=889306 RepID=A0A0C2S7D4_9BACL|nr:glycosyltransferase [Jeotgalibacillus soli]KIL49929.1 hypothetical protein KP78_13970 [Jeotgalibacillus soli]
MNKQPKISIITACFNSEETIEQTIQSVINQTYDNVEYILIDGASSDGTMEIVNKYRDRIAVLVSEKDGGVYDAFNKGIEYASGEYILFLNSDDYFFAESVIEQLADFLKDKNYPAGVYGDIYIKNELSGFISRYGELFNLEKIKNGSMPPHPGTLLSKKVILEFGGFDLTYRIAADFDLLTKIYLKYENMLFHIPILVTVFRLGGLSSHIETSPIVKQETKSIINHYFPDNDSVFDVSVSRTNEDYLKAWLEKVIFSNKSISEPLKQRQIKNVMIFGSGEMALLIAHDLKKNGIKVCGFLDNNRERQGIVMNGVKVFPPEGLIEKGQLLDAVIYGFQGYHEDAAEQQLDSFALKKSIIRLSWRNLISEID